MQFPEIGEIIVRFPMREWGWGLNDVTKQFVLEGIDVLLDAILNEQ